MPGVDFDRLRQEITMEDVLRLLNFEPVRRKGPQLHGPCPVHRSKSPTSGTFSVNIAERRYYCHKCHSKGNQLELWAAVHDLPIYQAALDLCRALGHTAPRIHKW